MPIQQKLPPPVLLFSNFAGCLKSLEVSGVYIFALLKIFFNTTTRKKQAKKNDVCIHSLQNFSLNFVNAPYHNITMSSLHYIAEG